MKTIQWTNPAFADLQRLHPLVRHAVIAAVERFASTDYGDVKRLKGPAKVYRLRSGDWRVRFELDPPATLVILRVQHRSEAYR